MSEAMVEQVTGQTISDDLTSSTLAGGDTRWKAPELIEDAAPPSKASDTYSYAMAVLELLTEKPPYSERKRNARVLHDVLVLRVMPEAKR